MTPRYWGVLALIAGVGLGAAPKPKKLPPEPAPLLPAGHAWTLPLDALPSGSAAMDDLRIYVPLQNGGLHAFDRETGDRVFDTNGQTSWPPVPGGAYVFIAGSDAVHAFDARTGGERWETKIDAAPAAPMILHGTVLVAPTDTNGLVGLRASDGGIIWRQSVGARVAYAPVSLGPDAFVVTLADGRVMALASATGERLWERRLPGTLSAPATGRDRVFVGSTNNFLYALDAEHGDDEWTWRTGGDVIGAAADGDRVYFVSLDNILRAVNRSNGNQQWKTEVPTRPAAPPVAFDGVVVLSGVAPRVDGYIGKTGAVLGFYEADADLQGTPLIDTTLEPFKVGLVTLTRDGRLTALRPTKMMLPEPLFAPLLKLPGRELPRERLPSSPNSQLPNFQSDKDSGLRIRFRTGLWQRVLAQQRSSLVTYGATTASGETRRHGDTEKRSTVGLRSRARAVSGGSSPTEPLTQPVPSSLRFPVLLRGCFRRDP